MNKLHIFMALKKISSFKNALQKENQIIKLLSYWREHAVLVYFVTIPSVQIQFTYLSTILAFQLKLFGGRILAHGPHFEHSWVRHCFWLMYDTQPGALIYEENFYLWVDIFKKIIYF